MHHLSVSWHIIPLKFSSWNITLWTKRVHQSTNFQIFECFNENSSNFSYQFWNHKVKVIQNLHHSSVSWNVILLYFFLKLLYFEQKEPVEVKFSDFWVVRLKFNKFLMSCLKLWFGPKEPFKVQNYRLSTAHVKFHQICTLIDSFCWKYIRF